MRFTDRLEFSWRYLKSRPVETLLVVLATALGVGLVAAMVSFITAFNHQTDELVEQAAYREILVEAVGDESELAEAVVEVTVDQADQARLTLDDLTDGLQSAPSVSYAYTARRFQVRTDSPFAQIAVAAAGARRGMPAGADAPPDEAADATDVTAPPDDDRGQMMQRLLELQEEAGEVVEELPLESFPGMQVTSQFFAAYNLHAASGSLIADEDVETGNRVVVLGSGLAADLFGEQDPLGLKFRIGGFAYTVIGVLQHSGMSWPEDGTSLDRIAYVPNPEAQISAAGATFTMRRFGGGFGSSSTLRFAVASQRELESAREQLDAYFDTAYGESLVTLSAPVEALRAERLRNSRVLAVILFLASAGLFIASINLFNLMITRVLKRSKSIGINRACGASRADVFRQFVNEAFLMSIIGGVLGVAAAPLINQLLARSLISSGTAAAGVGAVPLLLGGLGAMTFTLFFGVIPARQAARIDAALVIRSE